MTPSIINLILPVNKEGFPDQRFSASIERVVKEIGTDVVEELVDFQRQTARLQGNASKAGFQLALAILNEAEYLHRHHRFDEGNKFGFKSKMLRKQASLILENIGFRHKNAHKLLVAAEFVKSLPPGSVREWIQSLSPSHIYELSRMNEEGLNAAAKEATYQDFTLSAGWKELSVRRLEAIRSLYPKQSPRRVCDDDECIVLSSTKESNLLTQDQDCSPVIQNKTPLGQTDSFAAEVTHSASMNTLVEEFVFLANSIDWQAVQVDNDLLQVLSNSRHELMYAAHLAIPVSIPSYA
jgi:hypothetical protein